jgi:hypothetical protein
LKQISSFALLFKKVQRSSEEKRFRHKNLYLFTVVESEMGESFAGLIIDFPLSPKLMKMGGERGESLSRWK